ncbi:ISP domain-containing protein [Stipitochalara longipes BDJ]|nr:ISP domain-containing protein [Stipitochalara longipes BDJ]
MERSETYSYYLGLGIAIILGYALSSLRIERLFVAVIMLLPEQVSGKSLKKQMIPVGNNTTVAGESFPRPKFPAYWTEESIFELERRAIFSKTWLFVTHASRFQKPGDYRTYDFAGFSFIVILGKDKQLRTFHNVCRHRAYAVTKKVCGSSTVLGCRYHGWSYDTKGSLIKAPEFENVPGFDKKNNGLWEVKTEVREGVVFINVDARHKIEHLSLGGAEIAMRRWGTAKMKCIADWKIEAAVNWNSLDFSQPGRDLEAKPWWPSLLSLLFQQREQTFQMCSTTIVRRLPSGMLVILAAFPKSANSTTIECNILASYPPEEAKLEVLKMDTTAEVEKVIEKSQDSGIQGISSSLAASFPPWTQLNHLLEAHLDAERRAGAEIHPAARSQNFSMEGKADDDFCKELGGGQESVCSANAKGLLDW